MMRNLLVFMVLTVPMTAFSEPTFYAPYDKGGYIHLTNEPGISTCPIGTLRAAETKVVLDELKVIRELCYTVNEKKGMVELKDPDKYVFSTFTVSANKFTRIQTKKEREEAERKELAELKIRAINAAYIQDEKNRQARVDAYNRRAPITCMRLGPDMMTCD